MADVERRQQVLEVAMHCLRSAIESMERYGLDGCSAVGAEYQPRLERLRERLAPGATMDSLRETNETLDRDLREYAARAREYAKRETGQIKEILKALAGAAEGMVAHNNHYAKEFHAVGVRLDEISALEDPGALRNALNIQAGQLKSSVEAMTADSAAAASRIAGEMQVFEQRIREAQKLAATDPLTGLVNRREGERQLSERVEEGRPFCILLFDLDHFKSVNDRFGHLCGDQVLQRFSKLLRDRLRPSDVVCRWGGDEFLAILECSLRDAMTRAQQISAQLSGRQPYEIGGKEVRLEMKASAGVAEFHRGETLQQLFARADSLLYGAKANNRR
jgi:diguanylate cyclase (GGDEF)-like protein